MEQLARTAQFWDRIEQSRPLQFWDVPVVRRYRNRLVSGREDTDALQWFRETFVPRPFAGGISLGCGSGAQERRVIKEGIALRMTGIDIAPGRLAKAQQLGEGLPIAYHRANINTLQLKENEFDFALCKTILHHITKLEHVLGQLRRGLRPGALLYVDDYIGPSRFQFSEKILRVGDQVLGEIPLPLRRLRHDPWSVKSVIGRINAETVIAGDPSEAVRSDEINALLKQFFTVRQERSSGGALLFRLLDGIAHNFTPESSEHTHILRALCSFEENLSRKRMLPDIFKVYVLQNDK